MFPRGKTELTLTECCLSAGNYARPLPFMFSLNPHLLQERKELTFYKHTKAQSNLSLSRSDQGSGKTEMLTSQAPTKLDLLPGKYKLDTRHLSVTWQREAESSSNPNVSGTGSASNRGAVVTFSPLWLSQCCNNETLSPLWIQFLRILIEGAILQIKAGETILSWLMNSEKSI